MDCSPRTDISHSAIVILGASGDLAQRKLIPALAALFERKILDSTSIIVGTGRSQFTSEQFRQRNALTASFGNNVFYYQSITGLKQYIARKGDFDKILLFMALPPSVYVHTVEQLAVEGFGRESVLILEKPFGYNLNSARTMNREINRYFDEQQILRIDHYLAKEAVQNILVFRFANMLFKPIWNNRWIESIQINALESIGVEERAAYFDSTGIIRDMVQNHLMQMLCLLTMEAPEGLRAEEIREQKINILKALEVKRCCRKQYEGYRSESGIRQDSRTETYAELELEIHTDTWVGTPIYLRTGKALNRKGAEIGVRFKPLPRVLFNENGDIEPNKIIFKIQPAEGIIVDLANKIPGSDGRITNTNMSFCYRDSFSSEAPEAYQRLLVDALKCDRTLFVSAAETELAWQKIDEFLDTGEVGYYQRGTLPEPCIYKDWIDFERFISVCV